jgi:hypothetical protein
MTEQHTQYVVPRAWETWGKNGDDKIKHDRCGSMT